MNAIALLLACCSAALYLCGNPLLGAAAGCAAMFVNVTDDDDLEDEELEV
jgi:hypothetical protein